MVRGGRAEAPVPRSDVSFQLDQKTGNFKVAIGSRDMQWSALTEENQKNQLAQTECRFMKNNNNNNKGGQLLLVLRSYISVVQQQETGNFMVATVTRPMQWSHLTEE